MQQLKDKVALVTGGSRGLGTAIAEALADQGADVAITYVSSADKAQTVVERLKAKGVRSVAIRADQADLASAPSLIDDVVQELGKLDILVANAAIAAQGQLVDDPDLDTAALDRQWQVNVLGTVAVTRAASRVLPEHGRVIFIGSLLGTRVPFPGSADYAGTKAAIVGYAKGVARDLGSRNITVNVVQPGVMPTDMMVAVLGDDGPPDALLDMHPIRRIATLEEVTDVVCFLASPKAGYLTAGVIDVAGGLGT